MDDERQGLPERNSGRFHFDPDHDPHVAPDPGDLERWVRDAARREGSGLANAFALMRRMDADRGGFAGLLARLVPALARRAESRADGRSIAAATHELERVRELMREFAVDLTRRDDHAATLAAIAATAVIDLTQQRAIEALDGFGDDGDPGVAMLRDLVAQVDSRGRLERYHAGMRTTLENEAVINLMLSEDLRRDRERLTAALRAAREEVSAGEMRSSIEAALARAT